MNAGKGVSRDDLIEMHVPKDLVAQFRKVSQSNTEKGLELGGVLAGKFCESHYEVTHLIVPQQRGQPDRWEVGDER